MDDKLPPVQYICEGGDLWSPAYPGDAGMDVESIEIAVCPPHQVTKVAIGIKVAPPEGTVFTFLTRSSAIAKGIFVLPTLIDNGYRGPLYLFVMNFTNEEITVDRGNRIAQIVLLPNLMDDRSIRMVTSLPESHRGEKGFGSSGGQV